MYKALQPDDAARALAEIDRRQEQVIEQAIIPGWFWWVIAALMIGLSAAVESRMPVAIGIGVSVFVLGVLAATGSVAVDAVRHAQVHAKLLSPTAILAILGFVATVHAVTLPTAFILQSTGTRYPATLTMLLCGVVMVIGGPLLMRFLRRLMLAKRAGGQQ